MGLDTLVSLDGSRIARGLFHDDAIYELERQKIFQRCWLFVAHESQLTSPGDFVTSYMGEEPVIVTRTKDGSVRVLVNSCSHRGTRVCRIDRGNARTFTCPYHGWMFGNDGRLLGVPHLAAYGGSLDKQEWGLHEAAQVASCFGLVFATFDPGAPCLRDYLGDDLVSYLATIFDRATSGVRLVRGVQRWMLDCNWKIPAENQAPDLTHADTTHQAAFAVLESDTASLTHAVQATTSGGHGFAFRMLPDDADPDERLPGFGTEALPATCGFLRTRQPDAEQRLGPVRSRIDPIAGTVFPNFSVVPTTFSIRVSQPRGPRCTEVWSWCFVPADAPSEVAAEIIGLYQTVLGPAGLVEEEDGENWIDMTRGARCARTDRRPLHIGMGLGEEFTDPDLPGSLGAMWSEHNQRGFYRTWRRWMAGE